MVRLAVLGNLSSNDETEKDKGPEEHHAPKEGDVGIKVPEGVEDVRDDGGHFFPCWSIFSPGELVPGFWEQIGLRWCGFLARLASALDERWRERKQDWGDDER